MAVVFRKRRRWHLERSDDRSRRQRQQADLGYVCHQSACGYGGNLFLTSIGARTAVLSTALFNRTAVLSTALFNSGASYGVDK
ncbi:hypothetical protein QQ045_010631 [Rhodiola kirilowii]